MCLSGQSKRKMWTWRCLNCQLAKASCYQRGRAVWALLPLVKWSFCNRVFFSRTDAVGFSTGSARWLRDAEGWGQLPSFEEEERKQCWILERKTTDGCCGCIIFSAWKSTADLLFFPRMCPSREDCCIHIWLCRPIISADEEIYLSDKVYIKKGNAYNNKPVLSNTSLAFHDYCNHLFPDVHECPNSGLCLLEESPKTWLASACCWLTKARWGAWITPMVQVNIFELKWDLVKHTKILQDGSQRQ